MSHLSANDFYEETKYNLDTKNQIWLSEIADSHDIWCNCTTPFCHLLASIFPPGHTDRDKKINYILERDYQEKCRSGGKDARDTGQPDIKEKTTLEETEEDLADVDVDDLLHAVADAEDKERR